VVPHLTVDVSLLVKLLIPQFIIEEQRVNDAFKGKTGLEAAQNRLFCARGCCEFIRLVLETFIQAAAARPRDEDGDIDINAQPMYKRHAQNPVFQLPFFKTAEFKEVAMKIERIESAEMEKPDPPHVGLAEGESGTSQCLVVRMLEQVFANQKLHSMQLGQLSAHSGEWLRAPAERPDVFVTSFNSTPHTHGGASPSPKKGRVSMAKSAADYCAKHPGHEVTVQVENATVSQCWKEYTQGLDGRPALRDLETRQGTKWRKYAGGNQKWSRFKNVYSAIGKLMDDGDTEDAAVSKIQARLDYAQSKKRKRVQGDCGAPQGVAWKGLIDELVDLSKKK